MMPLLIKCMKIEPHYHILIAPPSNRDVNTFEWRFAGGLMMAAYIGIWILPPPPYRLKKCKLSGYAHARTYNVICNMLCNYNI